MSEVWPHHPRFGSLRMHVAIEKGVALIHNLFEWVGDACPLHPLFHATTSFLYGINLKIPICCVVYVVYCDLFNRAIPLEVLEAKDMIGYWTCPKHWSSWLRENVICDFFGQFNEVNECCRNCPGRRGCKESRRKTHD